MLEYASGTSLTELLVHLPNYGVLICTRCQFAIQPNALSSHLLRHQIYRNDRRDLLEGLSRLELKDPEEITDPSPASEAIPQLELHRGWICSTCGHCCVSRKRMEAHWSDKHNESNAKRIDARPAFLQTFFRGNKLRYFEVDNRQDGSSVSPAPTEVKRRHQSFSPSNNSTNDIRNAPNTPPRTSDGRRTPSWTPVLDLQSLHLLHHFITSAGLSMSRNSESAQFWTHHVPQHAFRYEFLMHMILATAAEHIISRSPENPQRQILRHIASTSQLAGLAGFNEAARSPSRDSSTAIVAFTRLSGIVQISEIRLRADAILESSTTHNTTPDYTILADIVRTLRSASAALVGQQHRLPQHSEMILHPEAFRTMRPITPDQVIGHGLHPFLMDALIQNLTNAGFLMDGSFDDAALASLVTKAVDVDSSAEINRHWLREAMSVWPQLEDGPEMDMLAVALQSAILPARIAHAEALRTTGTLVRLPPVSRFPYLPIWEHSRVITTPDYLCRLLPETELIDIAVATPALALLIHSLARSYASDDTFALWNGLETWTKQVSDEFLDMLNQGKAAALVVLALWLTILRRLEPHYWYLDGIAERFVRIMIANQDVQVAGLIVGFFR